MIIEISDTGTGIPAADRPKPFDAFFSTKKSGLGIGLLVSRTIVEAHGGHIRAEEAERGGAKFVIKLPASKHLISNETVLTAGIKFLSQRLSGLGPEALKASTPTLDITKIGRTHVCTTITNATIICRLF